MWDRVDPATITANSGDVLRVTLVSGVHNLSFPADQNPAGAALPAPGRSSGTPAAAALARRWTQGTDTNRGGGTVT